MKSITLGGGCFWCIETCFKKVKGVVSAISGYAGGDKSSANYNKVCSGQTKHVEVVQVNFDSKIIETQKILEAFFLMHDPTQLNRQGNDVGYQYSSVIFYKDNEQRQIAEEVIARMNKEVYDNKIVTKLIKLDNFYEAETYHQDYFENNPQNPYCSVVIKPKLQKFRKNFLDKWSIQKQLNLKEKNY